MLILDCNKLKMYTVIPRVISKKIQRDVLEKPTDKLELLFFY